MFELPEETIALRDTARAFASEKIAPHAQRWDEERHLPVDVLREAAALGMAGLYVREESGGTGLSRLDAATVFEALAYGCPTISAFLSIHNMVAWMIDSYGNDEQREKARRESHAEVSGIVVVNDYSGIAIRMSTRRL
jgi:alkylation response protein AidB-like acyl-CoA dehydrogenase